MGTKQKKKRVEHRDFPIRKIVSPYYLVAAAVEEVEAEDDEASEDEDEDPWRGSEDASRRTDFHSSVHSRSLSTSPYCMFCRWDWYRHLVQWDGDR